MFMKKKYDTNPLERSVLERAENARECAAPLDDHQQTQPVYEAPTQRFETNLRSFADVPENLAPAPFHENDLTEPYQSIFVGQPDQAANNKSVSSAVQAIVLPPTSRTVVGFGLPEKWAMILPYLPLTVGAIIAVITLFYASRSETRVRFHAAQGLALHLASWIVGIGLNFVGDFTPFGNALEKGFQIGVLVYFIVSIVRVWRGKANHIEALDDVTDFLNEKIKPKVKG